MLERVMAIVLLGFLGLIAGYALTIRFPATNTMPRSFCLRTALIRLRLS